MRERRPSQTASLVALARALADRGFTHVPRFSDPVVASLLSPGWAATFALAERRMKRADPNRRARAIAQLDVIPMRVTAIDEELENAVAAGCRQLVVLGAGLDTRAFRLPWLAGVDVYEVDHPATQTYKKRRVQRLRVLAQSLAFVAVNFERDSLGDRLAAAGHRADAPSVWLWEGVVMYLTEGALRGTLAEVARRSTPGSVLLLHYHEPSGTGHEQFFRRALLALWREPQIRAAPPGANASRSAGRGLRRRQRHPPIRVGRFDGCTCSGRRDGANHAPHRGSSALRRRPAAARYGGPNTVNPTVDQVAYWNGVAGERWARDQEAIDQAFTAFTAKLLAIASLRPGQRVLDVGCGTGTTALLAAAAVGASGLVVGVDVSAPMLARARERSVGRTNVAYVLADAASHDFEQAFDAALSRFGVMFFPAPGAAFARLRGALRGGGTLAFACWRRAADNEWVRAPMDAAAQYLPAAEPVGPEEPGPFAFADAQRVRGILEGAGLAKVDVAPFDGDVVLSQTGVDAAVHFAMSTGPTARALRDAGEESKERARDAITTLMRSRVTGDRVTLGGAVWLVRATAP